MCLAKEAATKLQSKQRTRFLKPLQSNLSLLRQLPIGKAALEKFEALEDTVSLTDCIVMAVADHYETKDIFGFDKQFADAGYDRLTPSTNR